MGQVSRSSHKKMYLSRLFLFPGPLFQLSLHSFCFRLCLLDDHVVLSPPLSLIRKSLLCTTFFHHPTGFFRSRGGRGSIFILFRRFSYSVPYILVSFLAYSPSSLSPHSLLSVTPLPPLCHPSPSHPIVSWPRAVSFPSCSQS